MPSNFRINLASGVTLTCAETIGLLSGELRWEVRSAGNGSKGQRWYAWAWIGTASPRHHLLVRRHLRTGELAFHYCFIPEGQPPGMGRLIRAAGLRWPVEEDFEFGKDDFGLDQSQVRLYTAITRHTVLVMAALAICAVTAAQLKDRTDTRAPAPVRPGQAPPADPGMIPLPAGPAANRRHDRPAMAAGPRRALVRLDAHPPGEITMVPPARQARTRPGNHHESAGYLAIGGCRTRRPIPRGQ